MGEIKERAGEKLWVVISDFGKSDTHRVFYSEESLLKGIQYIRDKIVIKEYSFNNKTSGLSGKEYINSIGESKIRDQKIESLMNDDIDIDPDLKDIEIVYNYISKSPSHLKDNLESFRYHKDFFLKELKKKKIERFIKYNVSEDVEYYVSLIRLLGKSKSKFDFDFITENKESSIKKALEIVNNEDI